VCVYCNVVILNCVPKGKDKTKPLTGYVEWAGNQGSLANIWKGCDKQSNALANMINGTEGFQFTPRVNLSVSTKPSLTPPAFPDGWTTVLL